MDFEHAYALITDKVASWINVLVTMLPNLLLAALIVMIAVVAARVVSRLMHRMLRSVSQNSTINGLLGTMVHFAVLAIGFFIALGVLNLDKTVTSLLAGAGIVGLALGFAFQDIAANFISGVIMALRKPIAVGDVVSSNGHFGTVHAINLRSTEVRAPQGQLIIVPNKDVFQQVLVNYSESGRRRIDLSVGVSYGDDLEKVKRVSIDAIRSVPGVLSEPEVLLFYTSFGDSAINFDVCYWVAFINQPEYRAAVSDGIMAIKQAFNDNQITIPFPIRTLDFGIKGGETLVEVLKTRGIGGVSGTPEAPGA